MAVQARTKAQLLSVVVDIFKTIMEARYVSSCQIISPASITLAMRLGSRIWVCALALLPHSRADQGTTSTSAGKPITTWIAQREFPKAIFSSYYKEPSADQQPQPIIHDDFHNYTFPAELTDPLYINTIVPNKVNFPSNYPVAGNTDPTKAFYQSIDMAASIINGSAGIEGDCPRCVSVITAAQTVARIAPGNFSDALIRLCKTVKFKSDADCEQDYANDKPEPAIWAQVLQGADVLGNDGQFICNSMFGQSWCEMPNAEQTTLNFGGDKPANVTAPQPNGQRVKVLHLSDIHLDPRYTVGAEAVDCPSAGCCRTDPKNQTTIKNPAPFNGHPNCDTPLSLLASALSSVAPLGVKDSAGNEDIAWALFTGDLMPRESSKYRNDNYLAYVQSAVFKVMKYFIPLNPVFPVLGALDAFNEEPSLQHPLIGDMQQSQSNNYGRMKRIIDAYNWLSIEESGSIGPHRMGYTAKHPKYPKLRIIALNTNFWALQNYYTYVNTTTPRDSIILSDLIGWLLQAEKAQERVWIVGHVPPFAGQTLPNHSEAFYQVIERFSPHVIAGIFFGHRHTDSVNIFYRDGGKDVSKEDNVAMVSWLAPSLSPNSGHPAYKVYEVDTGDFRVYESRTYYTNSSNLSNDPPSDANAATNEKGQNGSANGLVWELGYDAREAYRKAISWPPKSPLNAAFWHRVGTTMLQSEANATNLAAIYRMFGSTSIDGKGVTGPCDETCVTTTVCRMRAAKESLWEKCASDEAQKKSKASNAAASTQSSAAVSSAAPTKRSVDSGLDIEIDIYVDEGNAGDQDPQPYVQKRWGSQFWSKVVNGASKKAQDQGTSTKTMTVASNQDGSSSIAKRAAEPSAEPEPTADPGKKDTRYDDFTENILPPETTALQFSDTGALSNLQTVRQGMSSTGVQMLDLVISGQSAKTSYVIIYPNSATARAKKGRDLSHESDGTVGIVGPGSVEDHDQDGQSFDESSEIPDQALQRRDMTPADAPDTTTTAASNDPTNGASRGAEEQPWGFPIYRPEESLNDQILRRRSSIEKDGRPTVTSTQMMPNSAYQPHDHEESSADFDTGAKREEKRDQKREPGCSTYSSYSVCSSSATYVEYTPEQSAQILSAYVAGRSKYNSLMKTMARKTTSKWTTVTISIPTGKATPNHDEVARRDVDNGDLDKRSAEPGPNPTNFIDLAIQKDKIKSRASTWTPWTTNTDIWPNDWHANGEKGYRGYKRSAGAEGEPEHTALPEPDPQEDIDALWSSVASEESAYSAAAAAATATDPENVKRAAEPEPEPKKGDMYSVFSSKISSAESQASYRSAVSRDNADAWIGNNTKGAHYYGNPGDTKNHPRITETREHTTT